MGLESMVRGPAGQDGANHTSAQFLNIVGPQNMPFDFVQNHQRPTAVSPIADEDVQLTVNQGPFLFYGQSTAGPSWSDRYRRAVFNHGMQSWWGDWHVRPDMRRATMDEGMVLSWIYTGRLDGQVFYYPMGIGEPLGEVMRLSANLSEEEIFEGRDPEGGSSRDFYRALMADPALRAFVVPPVRELAAAASGGEVALSWTPPHETSGLVGYRVLRAADIRADFQLLASDLATTTFTDTDPPAGPAVYMVQAVFLREGGSGTLSVNSQGQFASLGLKLDTAVVPPLPIGEDVDFTFAASQAEGAVSWSLESGELPDGVELSSDGTLSGNPVVGGEYPVRLRASDTGGSTVERDFVIFVDASFTEVIDLDLRREGGLGLLDRAMPGRPLTVLGDAHLDSAGGMRFDGDGDALRLHNIGQASEGEWGNFSYTAGGTPHFSVSFAFRALPGSAGGVLVSKAASINSWWETNNNHFTIELSADGRVRAWQRNHSKMVSAPGFNDGQWHTVTMVADPALPIDNRTRLYVDGQLIGSQRQGDKTPSVDLLVGARWDDPAAGTLTEEFDGWIADLRYTVEEISEGEIRALHQRLTRDRPELDPVMPRIVGLPETLDLFPGREAIFPFEVFDQAGQPIRPHVFHDAPDAIDHLEVIRTGSGYALKVLASSARGEPVEVTLGVDSGYPGFTAVERRSFRVVGPRHDQFAAPSGLPSVLTVMDNDVHPAGRSLVFDGIVTHPVYWDDPDGPGVGGVEVTAEGGVRFHPPTLWSKPIRFEYRLRDPLTGETETAEVIVGPDHQPEPNGDEYIVRGAESELLDVLANDVDPLGGSLEIVAVTQPNVGSVRVEGDRIRYIPQGGSVSGTTEFSYTVRNEAGSAAAARVTVLYGNAGAPPLIELSMQEYEGQTIFNEGVLGHGSNATAVGITPAFVASPHGSGLDLSGDDGHVNLGNPEAMDFNPAVDSFSIAVALETTAFETLSNYPMTLLGKGAVGNPQFSIGFEDNPDAFWNDASVVVRIKGEQIIAGRVEPAAMVGENWSSLHGSPHEWWNRTPGMERWWTLTLINDADAKRLRIYASQHLVADVDTSGMDFDISGNGLDWLLGAAPDGSGGHHRHLRAAVDNLRIYDRVISPAEIVRPFREMGFEVTNLAPRVFNLHPAPGTPLERGKTYRFSFDFEMGEPDEPEGEFAISSGAIHRVGESPLTVEARIQGSSGSAFSLLAGPLGTPEILVTPDRTGTLRFFGYFRAVRDPDDPESMSSTIIGYYQNQDLPAEYPVVASADPVPERIAIETAAQLGALALGRPASIGLSASGGTLPHEWRVVGGIFPPGLELDPSGTLHGSPSSEGTFVFTLRATDANGVFAERDFSVTVAPADLDGNGLPDDWEQRIFGTTGVDPMDAPFDDGLPNLLRFALGADLVEAGSGRMGMRMREKIGPMVDGNNRYFALEFQRRRDVGTVDLIVETSGDLSGWSVVNPVRVDVVRDDGELQTVEALVPETDDDRKFYHLRVEP